MVIENKTNHKMKHNLKRKTCYVLQGGGALGAYQVGAYEAFRKYGYLADMIIGISIGGINAAIIAGNKVEDRLPKLKEFWDTITTDIPIPLFDEFKLNKIHNWFGAMSALQGVKGFYQPRMINPALLSHATPDQLSYYDTTPLRATLEKVIDFKYLNQKHMQLCLGAVELSSGEFEFFDSFKQEITIEHIVATGALPPAFPPVKIGDKYYVDGGVYSNTPIFKLLEEAAAKPEEMKNILCIMIDLFSASGPYPHSMDGMLERIKDIQYSSHSKRTTALYATTQNLSHAIHYLTSLLTPDQLKTAAVKDIIKLGLVNKVDVVRLIYHSQKGTELQSKDYNFSKKAALVHYDLGFNQAEKLIVENQDSWNAKSKLGINVYSPDNAVIKIV
ncbi:MAG: patatin-like phospholipase family protein [Burkholderiales bacterium]|nr:patatin-like phospholipase family protein [Burkholderiales bacterium]